MPQQGKKGDRNAKKVFESTASFNHQDRGGNNNKAVNKQGILDVSKAFKEKNSKGQSAKFKKMFAEQNDPTIQQRKVSEVAKARGNVIQDMRNLNATEAELKHTLYKQKQQQLRSKKTASGKYSLADESSGEMGQSLSGEQLTHGGKAINEMTAQDFRHYDRFDSDSDDERRGITREETTAHFGGGSFDSKQERITRLSKEEWEKLTLPERYRFLIQMSKQAKLASKGKKARDAMQLTGLDADYRSIMSMLDFTRGDDSDDEDEMEAKLRMADDMSGLSKEEYLQSLFDKYNIDPNAEDDDDDDDDEDGVEDEDMEDEDGEFDEDMEDEDMEDEDGEDEDDSDIASSDDEEVMVSKLDKKMAKIGSKFEQGLTSATTTTTTATTTKPIITHIDDDKEDQKWASAFGQATITPSAPKIGLDGRAIGSDSTKLESGLKIGSNVGKDDYLSTALTLKHTARVQAGDRLVSDAEKATRHRNYLLFLEERRLKRRNGDYDADNEDELEQRYEELFMNKRALKKQLDKADDELVIGAMMDGDDDDDDVDVSTGLRRGGGDDDDDEDDYDEDDYDEDDYDEDDSDIDAIPRKSTSKSRSGDSLDEDFVLDDDVNGIDYDDEFDDEEIETMEVGGETSTLVKPSTKRGKFGRIITKKDNERRDAQTRAARKAELGMFVNDIDGVLQQYYLSTEDVQYRQFIAKIKVTVRDEIPYNYEFPHSFSEFITMVYTHLEPILTIYRTEFTKVEKLTETLAKAPPTIITPPPPPPTMGLPPPPPQPKIVHFLLLTESRLRGHILSLILGRLFQLFHPRINASNEARIEILYRFLWRLLKVVTQQQEYLQKEQKTPSESLLPPPPNKAYIVRTMSDVMAIADVITSYIFTINELLPRYTGRACIGLMELFAHSNKSPDPSAVLTDPDQERQTIINTQKWGQKVVLTPPHVHELFAYKLLMQLYPLSDSRHTIMTPLQLLLAQSVTQCYIANNNDLTRMVFLIGLLMEIWRSAEKLIPEVVAALQSLIAVLNNSFIPTTHFNRAQEQYFAADNGNVNTKTTQTKSSNKKGGAAATAATPSPFKWNPIMLESWRECKCTVAPGTLNTMTTLPLQFPAQQSRSTGMIPLHWLTQSPLIEQQSQTEYFRYAMLTTLSSFVSSLTQHAKGLQSCNELLQPIITSLQSLTNNISQFIETASQTTTKAPAAVPAPAVKVKRGKAAAKASPDEEVVSLSNPNTENITRYTTLLTQLQTTLAIAQQTATASLVGRKPLEKYAAVIVPKDLEPRLDIDTKFNLHNGRGGKPTMKDEVAERKRLQQKLAAQQRTMRKEIKQNAFAHVLEQQKINAAKDEARKSRLTRARQIVQNDARQDVQNRTNFKKVKR